MKRFRLIVLILVFIVCSCNMSAPKIANTKWVSSLGISSVMVLEFTGRSDGYKVKYYVGDKNLYPKTPILVGTYSYYGKTIGKDDIPILPDFHDKYGISINIVDSIITSAHVSEDDYMRVIMKNGRHTFIKYNGK